MDGAWDSSTTDCDCLADHETQSSSQVGLVAMDLRERDILKQILDYLAAQRIFAFRLSTGYFFDGGRAFRSHSLGAGTADILAFRGVPIWIECKAPNGRLRPAQKNFQRFVTDWGHKYVVAYSIDDLKAIGL